MRKKSSDKINNLPGTLQEQLRRLTYKQALRGLFTSGTSPLPVCRNSGKGR